MELRSDALIADPPGPFRRAAARVASRHPFAWHVLRKARIILAFAMIIYVFDIHAVFEHVESPWLDAFAKLNPPLHWSHVQIVGIDDRDYQQLFGSTSPLDRKEIFALIDEIRKSGPAVVAVDLDLSDATFAPPAVWPPMVWAEDARLEGRSLIEIPPLRGNAGRRAQDATGIALVPTDYDGVVRRYPRSYEVDGSAERKPSMAAAIAAAYCRTAVSAGTRGCVHHAAPEEPMLLHALGNPDDAGRDYIPATTAMSLRGLPAWHEQNVFKDKIVLIGGFYHAARDSHVTPLRQMQGSELLAQAVENELQGTETPEASTRLAFIVDVIVGFVLVMVNYPLRRNFRGALLVSVLLIPVLAIAGSFAAFSSSLLWLSFVPMTFGIIGHELYDHGRIYTALLKQFARDPRLTEVLDD